MRAEDRGYMWDLYVAYEDHLAARGIHDFNDLLIQARAGRGSASRTCSAYSSVIVDEVQDLNLVAVQFLKAFTDDGPNQLLIIGDGQQSVYPGGFTLAEAGISVTGRGHRAQEQLPEHGGDPGGPRVASSPPTPSTTSTGEPQLEQP